MNLGTQLLFASLASFSISALATVKTHLKITQIKNHLSVQAEINTQDIKTLVLQKEALITHSEGLTVLKKADRSFQLQTSATPSAIISYDLNIDLEKVTYFLEDQNFH